MPVVVELAGLETFMNGVRATITEGLKDAAADIVDLASQLAPEDTGDLKNSGAWVLLDEWTVEISFGNGLPDDRALAQEYGTMYMPAQPYLGPALKEIDPTQYIAERIKDL